ncbi:amino acid--tRNA ligase-related protein, partial [Neisseria dentiae]
MSEQHTPHTEEPQLSENQIIALRREKLNEIRKQGVAFPNQYQRDAFAGDLQAQYGALEKAELDPQEIPVKIAGRMMLQRAMGKASFATVQDVSGQIQVYVNNQGVGEEAHNAFKHWDLGDIIGVEGTLFKTNHGELTVRAAKLHLLTKSLRPLPDKHKGLTDQEQKYRQRYADLITNADSRDTFIKRSQIIQAVRNYMVGERYLEVETPMMHPIPGGATAKPFVTHHNALDMPLYLRIAPELYLKRLVVGGLERVFEINRSFRNEGMSTRHNPEFTMMEFYEAFCTYERMMEMTEGVIRHAA